MELTLVVAATRTMGIGAKGTLPWTGLRKEMAYFARITKRLPPQAPPNAINAVIMGRKTWDSIPPRFRPLKGRLNIVISRSFGAPDPAASIDSSAEPVRAGGLDQALTYLRERGDAAPPLGRVFIIGGGQVYAAALALAEARRVLLTKIMSEFECDVDFPIVLDEKGASTSSPGWRRCSKLELDEWAGEVVPEGLQEENSTSYEFQMWRRDE